MIIDQVPLSGKDAYLLDAEGEVDLAATPGELVRTPNLAEGHFRDVQGIRVLIEADDLLDLFQFQAEPILSIHVHKEMYPKLFADPYEHRVHTIAGFEDFHRGTLNGLQPLEVDGLPTLVSVGTDDCVWQSAIYRLPQKTKFDASAWDLATTLQTPSGSFSYSLAVHLWRNGASLDGPASETLDLAKDAKPDTARTRNGTGTTVENVIAYRVEFKAKVLHDTFLRERHLGAEGQTFGRPLLRAVYLLERITPAYAFHSLAELMEASSDARLFEEAGEPPRRLTASLDVSALLTKGEYIGMTVHTDRFSRVEARLVAEDQLRPPIAGRKEY